MDDLLYLHNSYDGNFVEREEKNLLSKKVKKVIGKIFPVPSKNTKILMVLDDASLINNIKDFHEDIEFLILPNFEDLFSFIEDYNLDDNNPTYLLVKEDEIDIFANNQQLRLLVADANIISIFVKIDEMPIKKDIEDINTKKVTYKLNEAGLDLKEHIFNIEQNIIGQALFKTDGNKNRAAKLLKMNRTTLIEKLKKMKKIKLMKENSIYKNISMSKN